MDVDLGGLFNQNTTYDYDLDYEYKEDFDPRRKRSVWMPLLYSLVLIVGLLGNLLLLAVLAQRRSSWRVSDTFILHLGVADVLLLVTLPLRAAQAVQSGLISTVLCKICGIAFNLNFYCGIFLLACISLDHYLSSVRDVHLYSGRNPRSVHMTCLSVWLASLLLTIPDWIVRSEESISAQDKTFCLLADSGTSQTLPRFFHHVLGFLLPAAVLVFCCSSILLQMYHSLKSPEKRKAVLLLLPLVGLFFLCWVPYNITLMVDTFSTNIAQNPRRASMNTALVVTSVFGCVHASLRPLLYLGLCGNFRRRALAILRCSAVESESSLWELGVDEEAPAEQNHPGDELKQMTCGEQQIQELKVQS